MRVLVACEESQEVCKAFREKGHEAYSCDIQECSGGHPEWHIKEVVRVVQVKSIEYTLKPESELKEMPNPLREVFLNSGSKLEQEFKKALPGLLEERNSIRLESAHEDNFLYASRPFGRFIGDCISCSFYEDTNVGFSEGGFCNCHEKGAPRTCGWGFTCPYSTSKYNKGWKEFERIQAETIGAPSKLPQEYQDQLMSRFCRKD